MDTFGGFVESQFSDDIEVGTAPSHRGGFSVNSPAFVRRLLEYWGFGEIQLLPEDIVALEKIYPRLATGGIILVDVCSDAASNPFRGARLGYGRFVREHQLPERFAFGMGAITRT